MSVFQGSPQGGSQHELVRPVWEDVEGQESFPVSSGFELTILGLLVQEHNLYSAATKVEEEGGKKGGEKEKEVIRLVL